MPIQKSEQIWFNGQLVPWHRDRYDWLTLVQG